MGRFVVPGGGINAANKWVPSKKKFFIPVKVLSRKFRGKFLAYLKQAELQFFGTTAEVPKVPCSRCQEKPLAR
uniref:transposase n=1 Tax=Cohnella fermenti TaxID=2565925 RepID=UPI001B3B20D3|nr:transposase [Cohnella fermenti]